MFKYICVVLFFPIISGSWTSRTNLMNFTEYYQTVLQMTMHEIEERGFSSLKIQNFTEDVNVQMYNWPVQGTVTFANGFLNSMQTVYLNNIQQSIGDRTVNNETNTFASVVGRLHFTDVNIGFDILANLTDGEHRYTADYTYLLIDMQLGVTKNIHTNEITTTGSLMSLSTHRPAPHINYSPKNSLSEVLSRNFTPSRSWDGIVGWITNTISPIILNIVTHQIEFPNICFDCQS